MLKNLKITLKEILNPSLNLAILAPRRAKSATINFKLKKLKNSKINFKKVKISKVNFKIFYILGELKFDIKSKLFCLKFHNHRAKF